MLRWSVRRRRVPRHCGRSPGRPGSTWSSWTCAWACVGTSEVSGAATDATGSGEGGGKLLILTAYRSDAEVLAAVEVGASGDGRSGHCLADRDGVYRGDQFLDRRVLEPVTGPAAQRPRTGTATHADPARGGDSPPPRQGTVEPSGVTRAVYQRGNGENPSGPCLRQARGGQLHRRRGRGTGPWPDRRTAARPHVADHTTDSGRPAQPFRPARVSGHHSPTRFTCLTYRRPMAAASTQRAARRPSAAPSLALESSTTDRLSRPTRATDASAPARTRS